MSSTSIDGLRKNLRRIKRRRARLLRLREISMGVALMAILFAVLAILEMKFQLPPAGRIALTGILVVAAGALVWRYIHVHRRMGQDVRRIAHYVDEHIPELEQRLITAMEFGEKRPTDGSSPLVERLWQDTLVQFRSLDTGRVSFIRSAWPAAAAALLVLGGLFYALWNVNDFSLAGLRVLRPWAQPYATAALPVGLTVEPGTIKIQRGNDVMLIARIANAVPKQVDLYLQTDSISWSRVPMTREGAENTYVYFLAALKKDVAYYVDIGLKRSDRHRISVFDLPRVEQIAVDYVYPQYTGIENKTVKDRGDVIAPQGTRITLHAAFNKAVAKAAVHFGDGTTLDLAADGQTASGSFIVTKDATYTINVIDTQQMENEDPYEYFVRSVPDAPPTVTLIRPGRDRRVMSLEEVSVVAAAEDDYGLAGFALNYMVAGGENREVDFLAVQKEQPHVSIHGRTTLYLEDLAVKPGDFVFYYLTARDNNRLRGVSEIVSDIYFLEIVATEEAFRRAPQQAGGGGGGRGRPSSALVENQKHIIAATWKLLKQRKEISPAKFEENVSTITDSQRQVMQRAQLSLRRLSERLSFADKSYQRAVDHLKQAVTAMEAAIEKLTSRQLEEALGPEQSALQAIMKAQSESRNTLIQTARRRGGGGGGSRQNREREDLKELFEMEMGRLENRYELPKQVAAAQQGGEKDDTLEKLRDLARRQERLNRSQKDFSRRQDRMTAEQRKRHLEELRREQEELRQAAQELSRQMSRFARRDGVRQWSDRQRQLEDAARQMQEAEHNLRRQDTGPALTKGRQAAENLRDQEQEMRLDRQATVSNLIDALNRKAQALQRQEQQILRKLQALKSKQDSESPPAESQAIRQTKDVLADKEKMQQEIAETEVMLKTIGSKGRRTDKPDIADRALETLRALKAEGVKGRIEKSRRMLEEGWLSLSMETEKKIEQSIERVSQRLRNLERPAAPSREEQIRQAAADAGGLRRELENLQKEIEALQQSNARKQRRMSGTDPQPGGLVKRTPGDVDQSTLERMQQHLQRSRRYAQGLVQPWVRGERWGIDARSVQRELTQKEIQDFLSQPDLWKKLLEPVRELESTLQAEAKDRQLHKKLFAAPEETVPSTYRDLVEEYYRELSRVDAQNSRP
jgi:hypothetical protein